MSYIHAGQSANGQPVNLYYQDWGPGNAHSTVVLIHGWPLSHEMFEYQMTELPKHDIRCVAYDRRGFGKSSKPWEGYDYDTLADDLKALLDGLDLQDVTLVGFSMGGGEIARYMSRHRGARVRSVVFIGAVTPVMLKSDSHADGIERGVFDEMIEGIKKDRADFLHGFGRNFFGVNFISHPVSDSALQYYQMLAMLASPKATIECVRSFSETDFRQDLTTISVPALVIHGDADQIVPFEISGQRTHQAIPNAQIVVYEGAPHGLFFTHKEKLTNDLAAFIQANATASGQSYGIVGRSSQ
ncbi:alpha/beta hydrolase [Nibrella saemangeumensis]|uniref:Alpha/beta hydrolase n=1 Tax=Nibrella saemangeumensis TaxID=1084526 RepID=A0ABP8NGL7_9BACT